MGGGGKLPPRQKMINIMYLVLTALLAMNVSKDVLNAFVVVNESLAQTNESLEWLACPSMLTFMFTPYISMSTFTRTLFLFVTLCFQIRAP